MGTIARARGYSLASLSATAPTILWIKSYIASHLASPRQQQQKGSAIRLGGGGGDSRGDVSVCARWRQLRAQCSCTMGPSLHRPQLRGGASLRGVELRSKCRAEW